MIGWMPIFFGSYAEASGTPIPCVTGMSAFAIELIDCVATGVIVGVEVSVGAGVSVSVGVGVSVAVAVAVRVGVGAGVSVHSIRQLDKITTIAASNSA